MLLMQSRDDNLWQQQDPREPVETDHAETMLEALQRELRGGNAPAATVHTPDSSLQVHNCHRAIREVEVLRDRLRDAFESDADLQPEDVVILCPDLETYAPLVQAVFDSTDPDQPGHIPVSIAGRSPRRTRPIVEAYFRILEVLDGRFGASEVLDLLNIEAVASAAKMASEEVASVANWVKQSGACWGIDSQHRASESLPVSDLNTWQFGLDRLIMGYAMPPRGGQLVGSVVALDRVAGLEGESLGKLWSLLEKLRCWRERLQAARTMGQWRQPLCDLTAQFLDQGSDEAGVQRILDSVDRMVNLATEVEFEQPLVFPVVARELALQVDQLAERLALWTWPHHGLRNGGAPKLAVSSRMPAGAERRSVPAR